MIRPGETPESPRSRKLQIVSKFLQVRVSGAFSRWFDILTDDVLLTIVGDRGLCPLCGTFLGKPEVRKAFERMSAQYELIGDFGVRDYVVDGDDVAVYASSLWRSRGSGRAIEHESLSIISFEENLISRYLLFVDTAVLAEFVGAQWAAQGERHRPPLDLRPTPPSGYRENANVADLIGKNGAMNAMKMSRAAKIDLALRLTKALAADQFDALGALTTEDIVFKIPGDPGILPICGGYYGEKGLRDAARSFNRTWERLEEFEPSEILIEDSRIVFRRQNLWRSRGFGVTAQFESVTCINLRGDRAREYLLFVDTAALARSIK